MKLQRAADGGIAVWTLKLNGLSRAARNEKSRRRREPNPLSIRSVCQYVRKWTFVNLSGTAIMNLYLLPSQA